MNPFIKYCDYEQNDVILSLILNFVWDATPAKCRKYLFQQTLSFDIFRLLYGCVLFLEQMI